ncbi:MAG: VOC family protein [Dehalococcoidia bacterium]
MNKDKHQPAEAGHAGGGDVGLARPGGISYIQLPALDAERSADFYEQVFGWNIRGRGTPHVSFDDATGHVSGAWLTEHAISREPGVVPYVYVSAVDRTIEKITAHGGEIVRPPYPEGDLWVATFRDAAGNVIGIWQQGPR